MRDQRSEFATNFLSATNTPYLANDMMAVASMLRRRRPAAPPSTTEAEDKASEGSAAEDETIEAKSEKLGTEGTPLTAASANILPSPLTYHVAKWLILRMLGAIYLFSFLGAMIQNPGLMGQDGLMPAQDFWNRIQHDHYQQQPPSNGSFAGFLKHPSLFWWIPMNDSTLMGVYTTGLGVSCVVVLGNVNSWCLQFALWLLYFSIVTTASGNSFYAYGWESQLLETGFLAIFLCALPHWEGGSFRPCFWESRRSHVRTQRAPSYIILWLFRWLSFRISLGAGLIKVRGSSCWTQRTCLHYHFETQPLPSPLSYVYHFLPRHVQSLMVDVDLWVQLYTSFFVLLPTLLPLAPTAATYWSRFIVRLGGWVQSLFMVGIMLSGNFSTLNHLTIVPSLACLDDDCWPQFLVGQRAAIKDLNRRQFLLRNVLDGALLLYVGYLSWPVVANLLQLDGSRQVMNASFDPFRLVNTYGAFGSVGEARYEPIVQLSDDGEYWTEVEFPCKPGSVVRRPCFCAPYHYRVDWNIWFLGFKPHEMYMRRRESWLYKLLEKILEQGGDHTVDSRPWLALLDSSSADMLVTEYYQQGRAPRFAKVDMYHYRMAASLTDMLRSQWQSAGRSSGGEVVWWHRTFEENLVPPIMLTDGKLRYARIGTVDERIN